MQAFIVATVTQTRSRAVELRKELHPLIPRAASRQAYSFIAFDDFTLASVLSAANSIT
jgi:hypothetical protein